MPNGQPSTLLMSAALHLPQGPVANWGFVIAVSSVGGVRHGMGRSNGA